MVRLFSFMMSLGLASAGPLLIPRQETTRKLIVGAPGQILAYDFDGTTFNNTANITEPGASASWMIFKEPMFLYAVNENANNTRMFYLDPLTSTIASEPASNVNGSSGVVSLAFNKNQTVMVGTSYSEGQVDIWDVALDGSLKLLKQVVLEGPVGPNNASQGVHRAHQAILDPTGKFFAINDLGGDAIHFLDAETFEITSRVQVEPSGAGPRHGGFIGGNATTLPTHYVVVCELKNLVLLYQVEQAPNGTIAMSLNQTLSTFGEAFPPANATSAAAGELIVASNQKDIYVSNRLTGNDTDNISHFVFENGAVTFADQVSSGGQQPRMFSLSKDESILFSSNQNGGSGLLAFKRCEKTGTLTGTPAASVANTDINPLPGFGPQFVIELPQ
jgi:6-phosphogluconolactonase (cycloisomerase 2 family)